MFRRDSNNMVKQATFNPLIKVYQCDLFFSSRSYRRSYSNSSFLSSLPRGSEPRISLIRTSGSLSLASQVRQVRLCRFHCSLSLSSSQGEHSEDSGRPLRALSGRAARSICASAPADGGEPQQGAQVAEAGDAGDCGGAARAVVVPDPLWRGVHGLGQEPAEALRLHVARPRAPAQRHPLQHPQGYRPLSARAPLTRGTQRA